MAEDIRINEVQQVKDATYIPVVLADGSLGKIAKVDLAELIKPLIGFDTVFKIEVKPKMILILIKIQGIMI